MARCSRRRRSVAVPTPGGPGARPNCARTKSIVLIVPWGGPAQLDTWDLKPDWPAEMRGDFRPIATRVPGTRISEHLPRLAKLAHRDLAPIRSMTHKISTHNSATHYVLTGRQRQFPTVNWSPPTAVTGRASARSSPSFSRASAGAALRSGSLLPHRQRQLHRRPARRLPRRRLRSVCMGSQGPRRVRLRRGRSRLAAGIQLRDRLDDRRHLLARLDDSRVGDGMAVHYEAAYDLLASASAQRAFDLTQEPMPLASAMDERHGQSVLLRAAAGRGPAFG